MEFSWSIFLVVCVVNTLCMVLMLLTQSLDKGLPPRGSLILGTNQKFLYIQDFWTMTYGDLFGVPLIFNAFVHLVVQDIANLWWGLLVALVSTLAFLKMCLGKNHKPDYGFPNIGKISLAGIMHLFYFGAGMGAAIMCLWGVFVTGSLPWLSPVTWVFLGGGVLYIGCFVVEMKSGNFDPLETTLSADLRAFDEKYNKGE